MFTANGSTWVPQSSYQHALSMLTAINAFIAPFGIGPLVPSTFNVIWWVCLGLGALAYAYDLNLVSAENSLDPALCDDAQVPNLMQIAGLIPSPGSYSQLTVLFTGDATGQTVTAGTHVKILNLTNTFITQEDSVVPASGSASVLAQCDTIGNIVVLAHQTNGTVETLTHIVSVDNATSAIAGSNPETLPHQRQRLIQGPNFMNTIDGLRIALLALPGIQYAKVYYNPSPSASLSLPGSISLAARTLYMVVEGVSELIASTYASITLIPTQGVNTQNWTSKSGQTIAVLYDPATTTPVYVKVHVDENLPYQPGYLTELQQLILGLAPNLNIGEAVTSQFISDALVNFQYATINGVEVSLDGVTYGMRAVVPANSLPTLSSLEITAVLE